ncbi:MAG: family 16 glycoside hydrolase [Fimbriimonadaceae bacterium]
MVTLAALVLTALVPDRPVDVWAFRSVLDGRPRMLTLALSEDLYVAYDATHCSLVQAWVGGVKLDGSVYTAEHGPQPTSTGSWYYRGPADRDVWRVNGVTVRPRFRGYRFIEGQCRLRYELKAGKKTIEVLETPERRPGPILERKFSVSGMPKGTVLDVETGMLRGVTTSGKGRFRANRLVMEGDMMALAPLDTGAARPIRPMTAVPAPRPRQAAVPGATYRAYQVEGPLDAIPRLVPNQTPNVSKVVSTIDLKGEDFGLEAHFVAKLTARLRVQEAGTYTFRLSSDDGSRLTIAGKEVASNDGLHSAETAVEGTADLTTGSHDLVIDYFENEGGQELKLEWKSPSSGMFVLVPSSVLETQGGEVHVTSPGPKRLLDSLWASRPGDGSPLVSVHPGFDLSPARPEGFHPKVGGIDFLPDGRMVVCCWEPEGGVYTLSGVSSGEPGKVTAKRIAFGLAEPLGIKVVSGTVYVLQKQELTKLSDHDRDGVMDEYECVSNGWGVTPNFHEFAFGLEYEKGYFLANLATAIDPGGKSTNPQNPDRGKTVKINAKTGEVSVFARGLRTPNGIGRGSGNRIYVSDNQGDWLPASKLLLLEEGAFYGNRSVEPEASRDWPVAPPVSWFPQGEIGNSPSQMARLDLGPYRDQTVIGDVTHGGLKRVFIEDVGGVSNGCVFRFVQGLEAGINRVSVGPDGAIYVGGVGSTGNWGQEGKERFGLQRLAWNGKAAFDILAVRSRRNGFEVEFTAAIGGSTVLDQDSWTVRQWRYEATADYGGPKVDERALTVRSVTPMHDRKRVFVETEGHLPGHVVYFRIDPRVRSAQGESLWATEAWYTLNRVGEAPGIVIPTALGRTAANALSPVERAEGYKRIFDGQSTEGWLSRNGLPPGKGWNVIDGALTFVPGVGGGDIRTTAQFGDFEFRFDWKVAPGSNSGVYYRSTIGPNGEWNGDGPEYQILDDLLHADGRSRLTSAASFYALFESPPNHTMPAGVWNEGKIVCRGNHVEHWLNGAKVVEYEIGSTMWQERLAACRFRDIPSYGRQPRGHILLQDHGDLVAYKNLRIKELKP